MKLTRLFMAFVITGTALVGMQMFHQSMNEHTGVNNTKIVDTRDDLREFRNTINDHNKSTEGDLASKIQQLSQPADVTSFIAAGLTILPTVLGALTAPAQIVNGYIESVHAALPFIPGIFVAAIKLLLDLALYLGLLAVALRYKP